MKGTVAALTLIGISAVVVVDSAQGMKSQWDGVYTVEQSERGAPLYEERCAGCHDGGREEAPTIPSAEFISNWDTQSLGLLAERIRITMPVDAPGSLSRAQVADILAVILSSGKYPAGTTELPASLASLNEIKFLAQKPTQ
jgi:hypothetical protein